jgi:hypothetical protein
MTTRPQIQQIPNPKLNGKGDVFTIKTINCAAALGSWRGSMFAHLWLDNEGRVKPAPDLQGREREKLAASMVAIDNKIATMPVLGIGIQDNVEIGMGVSDFIAAIHHGAHTLEVHIPISNLDEFSKFITD